MRSAITQAGDRLLPRQAYGRWLVRLLGLALFVVLVVQFDLEEVARLATSIPWLAWLGAFGFNAAILLSSGLRWYGMVTTLPQASNFTVGSAMSQFLRYYAIGLATPGRAGELARAWELSRSAGLRVGIAVAVVLLERGIDVAASLALALAALAVLPGPWLRPLFLLSLGGVAVLAVIIVFGRQGLRWLTTLLGGRLAQLWSGLSSEIAAVPATWRNFRGLALARPIAWTLVTHALFLGICIALGLGLALPVPLPQLALAATLASVIAMLPVTIFGLGTREAALVLLLAPFGVTGETAIAYSLALLLVVYGGGILPGALLWLMPTRSPSRTVGVVHEPPL